MNITMTVIIIVIAEITIIIQDCFLFLNHCKVNVVNLSVVIMWFIYVNVDSNLWLIYVCVSVDRLMYGCLFCFHVY